MQSYGTPKDAIMSRQLDINATLVLPCAHCRFWLILLTDALPLLEAEQVRQRAAWIEISTKCGVFPDKIEKCKKCCCVVGDI